MTPDDDLTKILIQCPKCRKTSNVFYSKHEDDTSLFLKVVIDEGIVCDHKFLVYIHEESNSIRGYDLLDEIITLKQSPRS